MSKLRIPFTSVAVLFTLALAGAGSARADIINFESFSGPSLFGGPAQTLTITGTSAGTVTITGGTVLTAETNLPADETTLYGTCFCGPYSQTITLTFQNPITNFFLDLYNGQTHPDTFTAADNVGNSIVTTITSNTSSGNALISFPAAGTMVTITTSDPSWDFSIDNVGFDQATPGTVPEPASLGLMLTGALAAAGVVRRRFGR